MAVHLLRDLENLRRELLTVGSLVEDATTKSLLALTERRLDLAQEVLDGDKLVDEREIQVEEECLKLLALHQPVAADLRFIIALLKVNNDLERVGDLAGGIASRAVALAKLERGAIPQDIRDMAEGAQRMLRQCMSALVEHSTSAAREVLREDEKVDELHIAFYGKVRDCMKADPAHIEREMHLLSVSRYLERIADLATNIAEDVIFMVDGEVVRHQHW